MSTVRRAFSRLVEWASIKASAALKKKAYKARASEGGRYTTQEENRALRLQGRGVCKPEATASPLKGVSCRSPRLG
jgi:hypothetical protein